jgi:hypothetical protein
MPGDKLKLDVAFELISITANATISTTDITEADPNLQVDIKNGSLSFEVTFGTSACIQS